MLDKAQSIADALNNMPKEQLDALIKAHQEFGRLTEWCRARGQIEIMSKMTGIKVLKNTEETKRLKAIIDQLKPGGFKWVNTRGIDELLKKK